jgi:hypothetical protein
MCDDLKLNWSVEFIVNSLCDGWTFRLLSLLCDFDREDLGLRLISLIAKRLCNKYEVNDTVFAYP